MGMLVLGRQVGERVHLRVPRPGGGVADVWLEVVEVRTGEKVKLGVTAPRDVAVNRAEVIHGYKEVKLS